MVVAPGTVKRAIEKFEQPYKRLHSSWVQSTPTNSADGPAESALPNVSPPVSQSTIMIDFEKTASVTLAVAPITPPSSPAISAAVQSVSAVNNLDTPLAAAVLVDLRNLPSTPPLAMLLQTSVPAHADSAECKGSVESEAITGGDYPTYDSDQEGRSDYSNCDTENEEHRYTRYGEEQLYSWPLESERPNPPTLTLPNIGPLPADHIPFQLPSPNEAVERDRFLHPNAWQNRPGQRPPSNLRPQMPRTYNYKSTLEKLCYLWEVGSKAMHSPVQNKASSCISPP